MWKLLGLTALMVITQFGAGQQAQAARLDLKSRTVDTAVEPNLISDRTELNGFYIVHTPRLPQHQLREQWANSGLELLHYLPRHFWFARLKKVDPTGLNRENLDWIGVIQPRDRVEPRLWSGKLPTYLEREDGFCGLILRPMVNLDLLLEDVEPLRQRVGGQILDVNEQFQRITLNWPLNALEDLARLSQVLWVEPVPPAKRLFNDGVRDNMDVDILQEQDLYNLDGTGVTAGIWDGGTVSTTHPDFNGRLTVADPQDTEDHPTHVAGTLGGDGTNSASHGGSDRQWRGVAPGVTLRSYDWDDAMDEYMVKYSRGKDEVGS
jgi:hypothetical protein